MIVWFFILIGVLHFIATLAPVLPSSTEHIYSVDQRILLVFPVTMAIAYGIVWFDLRKGNTVRFVAVGGVRGLTITALICSTALTSILYAISWYLFPTINLFEARFTVNATLFASLIFISSKAPIRYFDIVAYFLRLRRNRMETNIYPTNYSKYL